MQGQKTSPIIPFLSGKVGALTSGIGNLLGNSDIASYGNQMQSKAGYMLSQFNPIGTASADSSGKSSFDALKDKYSSQQSGQQQFEDYVRAQQNSGTYVNPNAKQPGFTEEGNPIVYDPYAAIRSEISGAWDNYIGSLNNINSTLLPQQRTAQEDIARTQLQSGQEQINAQKASSLRDISSNMKNAFQAGNIYLGARGAGDSSAANQYQFALSQEASKQTGQLNEFVNTQLNQLQSSYDTQISQISQWFANAQAEVQQQIANGQLNKAQDINNLSKEILNTAMSYRNQIQQNAEARYNALVEWAANNSSNVQQLTNNIASIPQAVGAPTVDSMGNIATPAIGYGNNTNDRNLKSMFQNPAWFQ